MLSFVTLKRGVPLSDANLRPEFELLNNQLVQLYHDVDVNPEFLRQVKNHIELCEHIVKTDAEKSIIVRAVHWWKQRAEPFGGTITPELSPSFSKPQEITANDKRFLQSLRIGWDNQHEDDGA